MKARQQGAALLLALWLLLLMAGLMAGFALTARTEAMQGSVLRKATVGRYVAESGIELAAMAMLDSDPNRRWVPDGRAYEFDFEGHRLSIRVLDEAGKLDLNVAGAPELTRLFLVLGVEEARARRLAGAISDWRDEDDLLSVDGAEDRDYDLAGLPYGARDQAFVTLSELQQLLGMDPELYQRAAPHLTIHSGEPRPNPGYASAEVLQALGLAPAVVQQWLIQRGGWRPGLPRPVLPDGTVLAATGTGTYSISSRASRPDGTTVEVVATVRAGAGGGFGQLYTPLAWRVGAPN